ncbi:MAG: hypothetical protein U1A78_33665 [Polyangia bacterium]
MLHRPHINLDALREVLGATAVIRFLERELVKPQVNVAAIWKYFTTSVYTSGDLVSIATREALQNSLDAVRAAVRAGQLRKGEGRFEASWDEASGVLTWEDNGIGMDRATVRDKFLSLGDSGKSGAQDSDQAAGGFGVAKAVILGLSEHFEWELRTRDVVALSRRGEDIELGTGPLRQGTQIRIRSLPSRLLSAYSALTGSYEDIETRLRHVLSVCDLPEIELRLNGRRVEPAFSRRGGVRLADDEVWGSGTTALVRSYKRPDRNGAFWVRLGGLFQFSKQSYAKLPIDVVVDLTTRQRPGSLDYPLTASRDQLQGEARLKLRRLIETIEQENESAGLSQDYEILLPEGPSPVSADTAQALSSPELQSALRDAGRALRTTLEAEASVPRTLEAPSSQAPGQPMGQPGAAPELAGPMNAAEQLAAGLAPPAVAAVLAPSDAEARKSVAEALERASAGTATAEQLKALEDAASGLVERASAPGGGGLMAVAAVQGALARLPAGKPLSLSPFGSMAGLRISKKNFDPRRAAAFKRSYAKWVPFLLLWDGTLRLVAAQGGIRRAFRPGFVLDDAAVGMTAIERPAGPSGKRTAVVYVHPYTMEARVKAHREQPLLLAFWLHALACHELTHLDGRMDEGHSESYVASREALGEQTASLLLPIAQLAVSLLRLPVPAPASPTSSRTLEQRAWQLVSALEREVVEKAPTEGRAVVAWFRKQRPVVSLLVRALSALGSTKG